MALIDFLQGLPLWLLGVPLVVWLVATTLTGLWLFRFFHAENARLHACLLIGLDCSLAVVLVVIFALDTPYSGVVSIGPESYQLIYDQHMIDR